MISYYTIARGTGNGAVKCAGNVTVSFECNDIWNNENGPGCAVGAIGVASGERCPPFPTEIALRLLHFETGQIMEMEVCDGALEASQEGPAGSVPRYRPGKKSRKSIKPSPAVAM